jgi:hypothetical protein
VEHVRKLRVACICLVITVQARMAWEAVTHRMWRDTQTRTRRSPC